MLCGAIFMGGCYFWMFCFLIQQLHSPQLALYIKVLKCVVVANLCRSIDRIKDMEPTKWLGMVKKLGRISQSYAPSWARVNDEARESDDPVETQPWFCRGTEHFLHQTWLVGTWKPQYHMYIYIYLLLSKAHKPLNIKKSASTAQQPHHTKNVFWPILLVGCSNISTTKIVIPNISQDSKIPISQYPNTIVILWLNDCWTII